MEESNEWDKMIKHMDSHYVYPKLLRVKNP